MARLREGYRVRGGTKLLKKAEILKVLEPFAQVLALYGVDGVSREEFDAAVLYVRLNPSTALCEKLEEMLWDRNSVKKDEGNDQAA